MKSGASTLKFEKRLSFEEVTVGYEFKIVGTGRMEEGKFFHCILCGGRGKNFIKLERSDGSFFKVGGTCLGRVGLSLKKYHQTKNIKKEKKQITEVKKDKVEPKQEAVVEDVPEKTVSKLEKGELSDEELKDILSEL